MADTATIRRNGEVVVAGQVIGSVERNVVPSGPGSSCTVEWTARDASGSVITRQFARAIAVSRVVSRHAASTTTNPT